MKISFVIPAHNAADYIVRSVHSIIDLVPDTVSYEILIVENGSEDNTLQLAAGLADDYEEIRVLHSGTSLAKARNVGMRHASGDTNRRSLLQDFGKEKAPFSPGTGYAIS